MKRELRAEARRRLAEISPAEHRAAGEAVARQVWTIPAVAEARWLLFYASLPDEVPTDPILADARRRGIATIFPRCLPGTRELELRRVERSAGLRPGTHGIAEPGPECPLVRPEEIDAALIPGLAWDRTGARLGRGAGFYDRLLGGAGWRGYRCGLFFAGQELPAIPVDTWDVRMHAIATEREVLLF